MDIITITKYKGGLFMDGMLTVKEISKLWDTPVNQITRYCRENRIAGAKKEGNTWFIPQGTQKPVDGRKSRGAQKVTPAVVKKPLPIGVSSYRDTCTHYYYVDKTMLIKDVLDERSKVSLFTRPRRFGKTLNMDMLKTFFEIAPEDTSIYFRDKQIWQFGNAYTRHQGKYPVIFLSFKDVKCDTWEETYQRIVHLITAEFKRHSELADSTKIQDRDYYHKLLTGQADSTMMEISLFILSKMLREHYGIAPVIIIDEYDTPIQQGHTKDFYGKIIAFMRNLFSGCLKDNDQNLSFGFLTGILRVAKESIFSGLNNLNINSILDEKYSGYFGFTAGEVKEMAAYYGASQKYEEICQWYDGYRFGNTEIFNPWSVINYFNKNCKAERYWENTGNNAIIGEVLEDADEDIYENLNELLQGNAITTYIDTNVIYPEIKKNPSSVYSFLLVAGYLKVWETGLTDSGDFLCKVSLPNKEISLVYKKEIINRVQRIASQSAAIGIQEALYTQNIQKLQKQLQKFLMESVSSHDARDENSYHMMLLGLCAIMSDKYSITSNRESGKGRFDIQLMPKVPTLPGFLIEVKAEKNCSEEQLQKLAQTALKQIEDRQYETQMQSQGVTTIFKYGIAFSGKQVQIAQ